MARESPTLDTNSSAGALRGAIRQPALRLQSDRRLAALGPAGFDTVAARYRAPLIAHASELVGRERAPDVVERTFRQARGLFGADARSGNPGPWLYWMAHNLAVATARREARNGGSAAAAGNGADRSVAAETSGAASNGAATTLTFSEGTQQFGMDPRARRPGSGARVKLRNSVGQLVPGAILAKPAAGSTNGGSGAVAVAGSTGAAHSRRAAAVVFGICAIVAVAAFAWDRSDNVDASKLAGPGLVQESNGVPLPGQPGASGSLPGSLGGPTTAPAPPPATGGTATSPPPADATTKPGAGAAQAPGTPPPATGKTPPTGSATPSSAASFPEALTTLLRIVGVAPAGKSQANPLASLLGLLGPAPPKAAKPTPAKPVTPKPTAKPQGTVAPPAPPTTPAPSSTVKPVKPKAPPLGNAGPTISYTAASGQSNDISVTRSANRFKIADSGASSLPLNTGCRASGSKSEICRTKGVDNFTFNLGDKDDTLNLSVVTPATISGDKGDDAIVGGSGDDSIDGGTGADSIVGAKGSDTLKGGRGSDTLDGSPGDDVIVGGAGDDHLTGGSGTDSLEGGAGDDRIDANDGKADRISCGSGNDSANIDVLDVAVGDCEKLSSF